MFGVEIVCTLLQSHGAKHPTSLDPVVFKDAFAFSLVPPSPAESGEAPDCHFPKDIDEFGPFSCSDPAGDSI